MKAGSIVINCHDGERWWTAVIDAGNVGDANKIKNYIKHKEITKTSLITHSVPIQIKITKVDSLIFLLIHKWRYAIFIFAGRTLLCGKIIGGCSIKQAH